jgi:hypothetical protein
MSERAIRVISVDVRSAEEWREPSRALVARLADSLTLDDAERARLFYAAGYVERRSA